jgi:hypothetical protein
MRRSRLRTWAACVFSTVVAVVFTCSPAYAQGDPSKSGDLTGNFDLVVWLLIPLALGLALLTAYALGPRGTPDPSEHRLGGVSRALSRREGDDAS